MITIKVYGYARVSTLNQSLDIQIEDIKKYCSIRNFDLRQIYQDKSSGKNVDRPGFKKMIDDLTVNPFEIEAIIITKLDRMGRSLIDLVKTADWLNSNHIGLISIGNSIDTTTKEGRLFFHIMSSLAEYERELIIERTTAGRQRAIESGKKMGQPRKNVDIEYVKSEIAKGIPISKIAKKLKVSRHLIYQRLKESVEM